MNKNDFFYYFCESLFVVVTLVGLDEPQRKENNPEDEDDGFDGLPCCFVTIESSSSMKTSNKQSKSVELTELTPMTYRLPFCKL